MYLRWQYLGPSWTDPNRGRRRFVDKEPVINECRYRLSVVENAREPQHKSPHQRVVAYLGIVDEAQLNTGHYRASYCLAKRNRLMEQFEQRLGAAARKDLLTSDQDKQIRAAIRAAFPAIHPPPGGSYVVIPPQGEGASRQTRRARYAGAA